jgi:hypothetical protein
MVATDTQKDVTVLLGSTPKGVISLADATGICCFQPPSPSAVMAKKHTVFVRRPLENARPAGSNNRFVYV